jgi:hypothetical protein
MPTRIERRGRDMRVACDGVLEHALPIRPNQKFFGSFFQKRTASLCQPALNAAAGTWRLLAMACWSTPYRSVRIKSFLVLFFKKELLPYANPRTTPMV